MVLVFLGVVVAYELTVGFRAQAQNRGDEINALRIEMPRNRAVHDALNIIIFKRALWQICGICLVHDNHREALVNGFNLLDFIVEALVVFGVQRTIFRDIDRQSV